VVLAVDLDDKGEVTGVTVVEPKAPTGLGFEEAAVTAAYSLGFEPAEIAGKPAPIQIVYTFKFPLPKPAAPRPRPGHAVAGAGAQAGSGGELRRRVAGAGNRSPMSGILVTVYRSGGEAPVGFENITDAKGHFHFFDLQPGTWKSSSSLPRTIPSAPPRRSMRARPRMPPTTSRRVHTIPSTRWSPPSASAKKSAAR